MYDQRSVRSKLRYRIQRKQIEEELLKVKFMMGIGGLSDVFYIKCLLKKYQAVKKMFVLQIEAGNDVLIPRELSCDQYPLSYHYYDPILQIVKKEMSYEGKLYHSFRSEFNMIKIRNSNIQRIFLQKIGVLEKEGQPRNFHRYSQINKSDRQW